MTRKIVIEWARFGAYYLPGFVQSLVICLIK